MRKIVKMIFGSHLYGTDGENSDRDFKGVYFPKKRNIILQNVRKSFRRGTKIGSTTKNSSKDIDLEMYSLNYFIDLACRGDIAALDMLHAPKDMLIETSSIWEDLVSLRDKFYTSQLTSLVTYTMKQAAKYGIKGSRINIAQSVLDIFNKYDDSTKLTKIWESLPETSHSFEIKKSPDGIRQYRICEKTLQETMKVGYGKYILELYLDLYGKRAREASKNKNVDWKAVSHAIRACIETKEILQHRTITFPLKESELLKQIKYGKLDYKTEVHPILEKVTNELVLIKRKSDLPEEVDIQFWKNWLIQTYERVWWFDGRIQR